MITLPWEQRLQIGTHKIDQDEIEPNLPTHQGWCCPNGCGECKPLARQFYSYRSFPPTYLPEDEDELEHPSHLNMMDDGEYHKVFAPSCCPNTEDPLLVFDRETDQIIGEYNYQGGAKYVAGTNQIK